MWSDARVGMGLLTRPGRDAFCRGGAFSPSSMPIPPLTKVFFEFQPFRDCRH